ncbi:hypothetical protein J4221_02320 [Candidatus Pacearchaeota archaeon]|nr:hypothetical protein [Candidatus Pacearchaeota archaeon]
MKKGIFVFIFILMIINAINLIIADSHIPKDAKVSGSDILGEFDEEKGLPKTFVEYQEKAEQFKNREQNKSFLMQEWTKLLADNKFFGPILFYTNKFFNLFNFFWKAIFGMEFTWSWAFFISLGLWIALIYLVYFPISGIFFKNKLVDLIVAVIIASLIGISGAISKAVVFLTAAITNTIGLVFFIILMIILIVLYTKLMEQLIKKSEEEELERSKEDIKAFGKVTRKSFEEFS